MTNAEDPKQSSGDNINAGMGDNTQNANIGKGNQQFNVTSYNQSGGITGGIVNIGHQPRRISQALADDLVTVLRRYPSEEFDIISQVFDNETLELALFIEQTLIRAGWKVGQASMVGSINVPRGVIIQSPVQEVSSHIQILLQWMAAAGLKPDGVCLPSLDKLRIIIGTNPN